MLAPCPLRPTYAQSVHHGQVFAAASPRKRALRIANFLGRRPCLVSSGEPGDLTFTSSVGGDGARTRRSASSNRRARRGPARKLAKDAGQFPSVQTRHCGTTHQFQSQKLSFYFRSKPHHRAQAKALRELALVCPKGQESLPADGSKLPVRCYPCAFRNCLGPQHFYLCKDAGSRTVGWRLLVEGVWLLRTKPCAGR
jgi:hypothetical protein